MQKELASWKLNLLKYFIGIDGNVLGKKQYLPRVENETHSDEEYQKEASGTETPLEICKQAESEANRQRVHLFEDVTTGNNSRQAIVTTLDDLISARRIKSGDSSFQALGRMSDESIQSFFKDPGPRPNSNDEDGHTRDQATSS